MLIFCLLIALAAPLAAHNGTFGRAAPLEGIRLDGVLSDWPADGVWYSLAEVGEGDSLGAGDFSGRFAAGFSPRENVFYVAVEIEDDAITQEPEHGGPVRWDSQDGCELYFDLHDRKRQGGVIQLWAWGDSTGSSVELEEGAFEVEITRLDGGAVYEWRVDLDKLGEGSRLRAGRSLGFDVSFWDRDADGSASWLSWSPGAGKWNTPGRLADMLLLEPAAALAGVRGQVAWEVWRPGPLPRRVRLWSAEGVGLWVQAAVDSATGVYDAELPRGRYRAAAVDETGLRLAEGPRVEFEVEGGGLAAAPLLAARPVPDPRDLAGEAGVLVRPGALDAKEVDRFLRAGMDYHKIPGMSVALIKDSRVAYHRTFGVQEAGGDGDGDVRERTLFEAASMTKPVFAYAVARLVERGVLEWDTPLYRYLPYDDIAHDPRYRRITARMVATHRTGFPNWRSGRLEILFPPGTGYGYSGEGFEYLGKVVEHLTGEKLVDLVRAEVFAPMGMDNAQLVWDEDAGPAKAAAHVNGDVPVGRRRWDAPMMAASLHTDARTYARFLLGAARGEGIRAETLEAMMTPQTKADGEVYFGLGFALEETEHGPRFGHGGSNNGFTCQSAFYPDGGFGYVFMVNNQEAHRFDEAVRAFLVTGRGAVEQ